MNVYHQGCYIDHPKYKNMTEGWKKDRKAEELLLVRPSSEGNPICKATTPEDAILIANALNAYQFIGDIKFYLNDMKTRGDNTAKVILDTLEKLPTK